MNRSYLGRVVGAVVVAFGLMIGLFAQSASAQVIDSIPGAQIQAGQAAQVRPQGSASSYRAGGATQADTGFSATACGYWESRGTSYYTHCGNYGIQIRVESGNWWRSYETDMWVMAGQTTLTGHWELWGKGEVNYAWCISRC